VKRLVQWAAGAQCRWVLLEKQAVVVIMTLFLVSLSSL